jgi:alkylation response protein AidB-like acyl-CoA dehydrogenase
MTTTDAAPDVLAAARDLAPVVREFADETERGRMCPPKLVEMLHARRMFDMVTPRAYGGLEVDIMTMVRVLEELSIADASTGWVVGIGNGTAILSAYVPAERARAMYTHGVVTGGAQAPNGRARPVPGGYRVSGRWPFGSGSTHCQWLVGGSFVVDDAGNPVVRDGFPDWRTVIFPASDATIIDTWHVAGLRGTGSRDIEVNDIFVPEELAVSLVRTQPVVDGPLYRFPALGFLALTIAPIPLGIARRAIDEIVALATVKTPMGSMSKLRDRGMTQSEVARAENMLRSARAFLYEVTEELWGKAVARDEITMRDRALLRSACAHAALESAKVADIAYTLGGGTALYETSALQRCLRDAHAATQHVMLNPVNYEVYGRVMLGLDPPSPMV